MKTYKIDGKVYAVIGEELYEKMPDWDERQVSAAAHAETPTRKKYGSGKVNKTKKGVRGTAHCKVCDGYGHFAKTCPKRDGTLPPDEVEEEVAHRPEVTKELVDELRAKGLNSIQIAARLKTSLSEVNKHW